MNNWNACRLVEALGARNGAHLLRQAADDESIVGGSMIPLLRNRAQPKLAETQRLGAERGARLLRVKRTCELHKTPDMCLGLSPDRRASVPIIP